jgi:hypothetical protein
VVYDILKKEEECKYQMKSAPYFTRKVHHFF